MNERTRQKVHQGRNGWKHPGLRTHTQSGCKAS